MIRTKTQVYLISAVAAAGSLLYFYLDPANSRIFPPCPFYKLTGFFCPGCGSQRAFHDLLEGDIFSSADHNLLFVVFMPLAVYSAVVIINNIFRRKKMVQRLFHSYSFALTVLIVVVAFWVLRNIPVTPLSYLAP